MAYDKTFSTWYSSDDCNDGIARLVGTDSNDLKDDKLVKIVRQERPK